MEALNMLGLGAVLGPYQAVKDDVSVCCVRCCAGRRVGMNRAMQHGHSLPFATRL